MHISVDKKKAYAVIDMLVARRIAQQYPFDRDDAIIPQNLIPDSLRNNKEQLARFYFFLCTYMRGGIESVTAFKQLLKLYGDMPQLFDPWHVAGMERASVVVILKRYIGWDSASAGRFWCENAKRLLRDWHGNPLNLLRGLRTYKEAVRRIANKNTAAERIAAGSEGFIGFQEKMVSMLLYFYDWEGWLEPRFVYPSPADFHHYRLFIATRAVTVTMSNDTHIRYDKRISHAIREIVVGYLVSRKADTIVVADALWLYSLLMCGTSPVTRTRGGDESPVMGWNGAKLSAALYSTCVVCPLEHLCQYGIPSQPYYRKGRIVLLPRPRVPTTLTLLKTPRTLKTISQHVGSLFPTDSPAE